MPVPTASCKVLGLQTVRPSLSAMQCVLPFLVHLCKRFSKTLRHAAAASSCAHSHSRVQTLPNQLWHGRQRPWTAGAPQHPHSPRLLHSAVLSCPASGVQTSATLHAHAIMSHCNLQAGFMQTVWRGVYTHCTCHEVCSQKHGHLTAG